MIYPSSTQTDSNCPTLPFQANSGYSEVIVDNRTKRQYPANRIHISFSVLIFIITCLMSISSKTSMHADKTVNTMDFQYKYKSLE